MTNIAILKGDKLKSAMKGFKKRVRSWTEYVASIGISVVVHAAEHGDVSLLNQFYDALPNAYSRPFVMWLGENGVREWLRLENGEFKLKKSDDAKKARQAFAENPPVEDWTEFKTRKETSFDLDAVIRRLDSLEKKVSDELAMPEEFHTHIREALAIAQRLKDAREQAMPVAA